MTASIRNVILYKTHLSVEMFYQINYISVSIYITPTSIIITYRNLILDLDSYTATVDSNTYELTQREYEVLRELLTHQGLVLNL